MTKKTQKTPEAPEPHSVELLGVTHVITDMDYFTPNMRFQLGDIMQRLMDDEITQAQAIQEMGLLLTHHPRARRPVTFSKYVKMLTGNDELFQEVINAGTAVMSVFMDSATSEGDGEENPKAETGTEPQN